MLAAMYMLKGSVYELQDNWPLAARCYTDALHADPLCYEALDRLVQTPVQLPPLSQLYDSASLHITVCLCTLAFAGEQPHAFETWTVRTASAARTESRR